MFEWTLATRDGFFAIHGDSMEDEVITGQPLIVDPSITFRKHFEIPDTIDKRPEKLKLELFSRFLPSEIDNYICQFQDGPVTDEGTRRVLGMAIKEQDMQWLEGLHGEESEKYFLENLLQPSNDSGQPQGFELPLPGGVFFGVFRDNFLTWARYLGDPGEKALDKTREYIHEEYSEVPELHQGAGFPADEGDPSDWINAVKHWLPETPDSEKILSRERSKNHWEQWRTTAWTLLVLAYLTAGTWTLYNYTAIQHQQRWLETNSKKLFEDPRNPIQHLQSEIQSLQEKLRTQSDQVLDMYPRLYQLDRAIESQDVFLLQLKLRKNQGQLVLATDSLQSAENMKETLLNVSNIERVEIVSTNPQQDETYQYKVNLNMKWTTES